MVTAQRHQDIVSALRIAREFDLRLVLDGAAESYLLLDELRAADVPVIVEMASRGRTEVAVVGLEFALVRPDPDSDDGSFLGSNVSPQRQHHGRSVRRRRS